MYALTDPDASIIVGLFVLIGTLAGIFVQNKRNTKAQRSDHAATADLVREIRTNQIEMSQDVREIKADVRDHGERLRSLEHLSIRQDEVEAIVSQFPRRKAQ